MLQSFGENPPLLMTMCMGSFHSLLQANTGLDSNKDDDAWWVVDDLITQRLSKREKPLHRHFACNSSSGMWKQQQNNMGVIILLCGSMLLFFELAANRCKLLSNLPVAGHNRLNATCFAASFHNVGLPTLTGDSWLLLPLISSQR